MRLTILSALVALTTVVNASVLTPPVLPLAVRNPYLSTWLGHARGNPWDHWPIFWTGSTFGFGVLVSVPENRNVYPLLGRPQDFIHDKSSYDVAYPDYLGAVFDASTTNLTYKIGSERGNGAVQITLSFMSPITPTSTFRQALPASYLTVIVEGDFEVSVFIDINGEWVSGNRDNQLTWELFESKSASKTPIKSWKVSRTTQQLFTEHDDHAEWGTFWFSGPKDAQHQAGEIRSVHRQFAAQGSLSDSIDSSFRSIFDREPVFAFSKRLKPSSGFNGTGGTDSVLFTFSLVQDPVTQFASARGLTHMRPLWASYFFNAESMLQYHYDDFETATALASNYSNQLGSDAFRSGSQDYQDIAALSARQVFGATQWAGTPDAPILFLKEISSNGNFQTVDVIFPAFPFFLYTNPQWLQYLLDPLIEHQLSGQYPNDYSMHDLGTHFPNATGHGDGNDEPMPLEECGNMLIMVLAIINALKENPTPTFARVTPRNALALQAGPEKLPLTIDAYGIDRALGEAGQTGLEAAKEWALRAYPLLKKWTRYLVEDTLIPANQLCTDDFAGWLANQTNLALKGIVGIRAMSEIENLVGDASEAENYRRIAEDYIEKWQGFGIARDKTHAKLSYTWQGSWTTLYNLYADALLCFHIPKESKSSSLGASRFWPSDQISLGDRPKDLFIPQEVYTMQSDWYHNVLQRYGLPLDQRSLQTKSDWEFFAAAITQKEVRAEILQHVAQWVNETSTDLPFTDLYETEGTGGFPGLAFKARPVVGGHFAFLALERACGGKAIEALDSLHRIREPAYLDVKAILEAEIREGPQWPPEL